ncbi:uncharacterized protein LOC144557107 [Carex rostrata]
MSGKISLLTRMHVKEDGGLGVMDLKIFNEALLLKWFWRWTKPQHTLLKPPLAYTGITKDLLPNTVIFQFSEGVKRFWSMSTIRIVGSGASIRSNPINENQEDDVKWRWQPNGIFTVKSAYVAIQNGPRITREVHLIWKLKAPPRFKVFAWLMLLNKVLTIDNLSRKGWCMVNRCAMCKSDTETVLHLFNTCPIAQQLNTEVARVFQTRLPCMTATKHPILDTSYTAKERSIFLISAFIVWRERCTRIFRETESTVAQLLVQIEEQLGYTGH